MSHVYKTLRKQHKAGLCHVTLVSRNATKSCSCPVGLARTAAGGWSTPPAPGDSAYRCTYLGVYTLEDECGHINATLIFLEPTAAEESIKVAKALFGIQESLVKMRIIR